MYRGCISVCIWYIAIRTTNTHKCVNWRSMRMNTTTRARVITERVCRRQSNETHHFPQSFSSPRFAHCPSFYLFSCDQRVFFFFRTIFHKRFTNITSTNCVLYRKKSVIGNDEPSSGWFKCTVYEFGKSRVTSWVVFAKYLTNTISLQATWS